MGVPRIPPIQIPAIGLGTWQLEGRNCNRQVLYGLEIGYRLIDTAEAYRNEEQIGSAIQESGIGRSELFLISKLWLENLSRDASMRSAEQSLRKLRTDYLDLLLIHWPSEDVPIEETLEAMVRLQQESKVRHIGVSNFPPPLLELALRYAPVAGNEVEYHPFLGQPELLSLARQRTVVLIAYSPLARGLVAQDRALQQIAERHGKTPAQVALRWLIQQERVVAIPKAGRPEHLRENFEIFDFELEQGEMKRIFELDRGQRLIDPSWSPAWEA